MKKFILAICLSLAVILVNPIPVYSADVTFFGALYREPINESLTVSWAEQDVDGFELKITHFFYPGLETAIVETTETTYTFTSFPKSSRHFEIMVRAYNESSGGRLYSTWTSSTDASCSSVDGQSSGWLIYTTPGTIGW